MKRSLVALLVLASGCKEALARSDWPDPSEPEAGTRITQPVPEPNANPKAAVCAAPVQTSH